MNKEELIKKYKTDVMMNPHLEIDIESDIRLLSYCLEYQKKGNPELMVDCLLGKNINGIDEYMFIEIFCNKKCYEECYENFMKLANKNKKELLESALKTKKISEVDVEFLDRFPVGTIYKIITASGEKTPISNIRDRFHEIKGKHGKNGLAIDFEFNKMLNDIIEYTKMIR
jgi:hypothetical protein